MYKRAGNKFIRSVVTWTVITHNLKLFKIHELQLRYALNGAFNFIRLVLRLWIVILDFTHIQGAINEKYSI